MPRLVLDTDVIVAGMRSPSGASAALIRAGRHGEITLLASVAMVLEYEAICTRKEHRQAASLSPGEVEDFLNTLTAVLEPIKPYFVWRPQLPDEGDEMILETAINGKADGIVTFNRRDFRDIPMQFGIHLWQPSEALRRIRI